MLKHADLHSPAMLMFPFCFICLYIQLAIGGGSCKGTVPAAASTCAEVVSAAVSVCPEVACWLAGLAGLAGTG